MVCPLYETIPNFWYRPLFFILSQFTPFLKNYLLNFRKGWNRIQLELLIMSFSFFFFYICMFLGFAFQLSNTCLTYSIGLFIFRIKNQSKHLLRHRLSWILVGHDNAKIRIITTRNEKSFVMKVRGKVQ